MGASFPSLTITAAGVRAEGAFAESQAAFLEPDVATEMVGGQYLTAGFKTADIAALVIILVEISMGLFLMESLRITRLFPVIAALKDTTRIRMVWITFSLLFILASVEAGLAFMREMLLEDELATSALLRGDDVARRPCPWLKLAKTTWPLL